MGNNLLNWKKQVDNILQKCTSKLNALKMGGKHFPFKVRLETARAVSVHTSTMFYVAECWGPGLTKAQIKTLQASQNRMLKWVVGNRNRDYRTKDLLRETGNGHALGQSDDHDENN